MSARIDPKVADHALDVAWNLKVYKCYGRNRATALRALRDRSGLQDPQARAALLDAALELVQRCADTVSTHEEWIDYRGDSDWARFADELPEECATWGRDRVSQLASRIVLWMYLK